MTPREAILDPTGLADAPAVATLAPRVRGLDGLRLGLLDNAKPNAALVLQTLADQLRAQHHLGEVTTYTKSYFGTPAFAISSRARVFEPIASIAEAGGPMKVMPRSSSAAAKLAFSARNP